MKPQQIPSRNLRLAWLTVAICLALLVARPAYARVGVVKLVNGQTYEGDIDEKDPTFVTVTAKGIQTRLDRSRVTSIAYSDEAATFADQLAKINPKDGPANLALARKAFNAQQYTVARDAVERVLVVDPNNADAASLRDTITSQMRLERTRTHPTDETHPAPASVPTTQSNRDGKVLRLSEINAIRQAEMRHDDVGMRIRFERNLLHRYVDFIGKDRAGDFYALNSMQQAQEIMHKGSPEMQQDITILNDPPSLLQYRRVVQPFIVQNCATANCHAGAMPASAKFAMIVPSDSDAATYTNFYNLVKYEQPVKDVSGSVFGSTMLKLIDRQRPSSSLLLQYALPAATVQNRHPESAAFKTSLRGIADPRYRQLLDWVGQSLKPVDPDYAFDKPATTQPATPGPTAKSPTAPARAAQQQ